MSTLPPDLDLSALKGQALSQIRLGQYDLQFIFDGGWSICGGRAVDFETDGKTVHLFRDHVLGDTARLAPLLGARVSDWSIAQIDRFHIDFEPEQRLLFISSDNPYEDFVIMPDGWVIY